jgi:hypothetical protein
MEVSVYNVLGKCIKNNSIAVDQLLAGGTRVALGKLASGLYVASVKIDGTVLQRSKIVIP